MSSPPASARRPVPAEEPPVFTEAALARGRWLLEQLPPEERELLFTEQVSDTTGEEHIAWLLGEAPKP